MFSTYIGMYVYYHQFMLLICIVLQSYGVARFYRDHAAVRSVVNMYTLIYVQASVYLCVLGHTHFTMPVIIYLWVETVSINHFAWSFGSAESESEENAE